MTKITIKIISMVLLTTILVNLLYVVVPGLTRRVDAAKEGYYVLEDFEGYNTGALPTSKNTYNIRTGSAGSYAIANSSSNKVLSLKYNSSGSVGPIALKAFDTAIPNTQSAVVRYSVMPKTNNSEYKLVLCKAADPSPTSTNSSWAPSGDAVYLYFTKGKNDTRIIALDGSTEISILDVATPYQAQLWYDVTIKLNMETNPQTYDLTIVSDAFSGIAGNPYIDGAAKKYSRSGLAFKNTVTQIDGLRISGGNNQGYGYAELQVDNLKAFEYTGKSSIELSGIASERIPKSGSTAIIYSADVFDRYKTPLPGETVSWAVYDAAFQTVSPMGALNISNGILTVNSSASAGNYKVKAVLDSDPAVYAVKDIELTKIIISSIDINGSSTISVPISAGSTETAQYTAQARDNQGNVDTLETVAWTVYDSASQIVDPAKISIDSSGLVTVYSTAAAGEYRVKAASTSNPSVSSYQAVTLTPMASNILIKENFEIGSSSNFTVAAGGVWSVANGRYNLTVDPLNKTNNGIGHIANHNTPVSGDFSVSALCRTNAVTVGKWEDFSIIIGYQDLQNYYDISFCGSSNEGIHGIFKVENGVKTKLVEIPTKVSPNRDYNIEIIQSNQVIAVKIDGTMVATTEDPSFSDGKVGLRSNNDNCEFDNFIVDTSPTPLALTASSIAISSPQTNSFSQTQAAIPSSGTKSLALSSKVYNQYGNRMLNESVQWAVYDATYNPVAGLIIDSNGLLGIASTVPDGKYIINARSVSNPATCQSVEVNLSKVTKVDISGARNVNIPQLSGRTTAYKAYVLGTDDQLLYNEPVVWSVTDQANNGASGLSINQEGVLTIAATALPGTYKLSAALADDSTKVYTINLQVSQPDRTRAWGLPFTQRQLDEAIATQLIDFDARTKDEKWANNILRTSVTFYYLAVSAKLDSQALSSNGVPVKERVLEHIRNILIPGNEPNCWGGTGGWGEGPVAQGIALAKSIPDIWNELTVYEKEKLDWIMKSIAVTGHIYTNNGAPRTSERMVMDMTPESTVIDATSMNYAPNHYWGSVSMMVASGLYFGADMVDQILTGFAKDEFVAAFDKYGMTNVKTMWKQPAEWMGNGYSVTVGTKTYSNAGVNRPHVYVDKDGDAQTLRDLLNYVKADLEYQHNKVVADKGSDYDRGYQITGTGQNPFLGQMGMFNELNRADRSSIAYAIEGWRSTMPLYLSLKLLNLWGSGEWQSQMEQNMAVGAEDAIFKALHGWYAENSQFDASIEKPYWYNQLLGVAFDQLRDIHRHYLAPQYLPNRTATQLIEAESMDETGSRTSSAMDNWEYGAVNTNGTMFRYISEITNGEWVIYDDVQFGNGCDMIEAKVSSDLDGTTIDVEVYDHVAKVWNKVGTIGVANTGSLSNYSNMKANLDTRVTGTKRLRLRFNNAAQAGTLNIVNMDSFQFAVDTEAPVAPVLSEAGKTTTTVSLSWTAAVDNIQTVSYDVYSGTTKLESVAGSVYSFAAIGLSPATTYTFKVVAKDAAGNEAASNELTLTTEAKAPLADTQAPQWPTGASITASEVDRTGMKLSWTAATDNVAVTGYKLFINDSTAPFAELSGNTGEHRVTGLTKDTEYKLTLKAYDANGNESAGLSITQRTDKDSSDTTPADPGEPGVPATPAVPNVPVKGRAVKPELDAETGEVKIKVEITEDTFVKAKETTEGEKKVTVEVQKVEGAKSYTAVLPAAILNTDRDDRKVELKTEFGTVIIPGNMLENAGLASTKAVELNIGKADISKLPEKVKSEIGDKPVINLAVYSEGKKIEYNNPEAPVKVVIPYTPTTQELKNPEHIVVWYIDEKGKTTEIPSGRYDAATQSVTFTTTHFSQYAIAYVVKTFEDIGDYGWAKKEIEVLASKGIIEGATPRNYNPSDDITRADYTLLIIKTLGLAGKVDTNFADVKPEDYYYEAVGIARKLGIIDGVGGNKFNPREQINRQDMFTITARALKKVKQLKEQGTAQDLDRFTDKGAIASYAVESMAAMVKEGLVRGDGTSIHPEKNATRAETAVLMYRIYNK